MLKSLVRVLLFALIGGLVFILTTVITLMITVDPNDYKSVIAQQVSEALGRPLTIEGAIHWSWIPQFGIQLGPLRLGNVPGFETTDFAKIESAHLALHWWPLIRQQLELGTISLDGLQLTLSRQADGNTNWQDLLASSPKNDSPTLFERLTIERLNIHHAQIVWHDQQAQRHYVFSNLNLETEDFAVQQRIPFQLKTQFTNRHLPEWTTQVHLEAQLRFTPQRYQIELKKFSAQRLNQKSPLLLKGNMVLDLAQQVLTLNSVELQALETTLRAKIDIRSLLSTPHFSGRLQLATAQPQRLATWLNLPDLAIQSAILEAQFQGDSVQVLDLEHFHLQLDQHILASPKVQLNWLNNTLTSEHVMLKAWGLTATGKLEIKQLLTPQALHIQGQLHAKPFQPRQVWAQLTAFWPGLDLKPLPDLKAYRLLETMQIHTRFSFNQSLLVFEQLNLILDDNQLKTAQLRLHLAQNTLEAKTFSLSALDILDIEGELKIEQLLTQPRIQARLATASFNPQHLFQRFGQTPPHWLTQAALKTDLHLTLQELILTQLQLTLAQQPLHSQRVTFNFSENQMTLTGMMLKLFDTLVVQGDFTAQQLFTPQFHWQGQLHTQTFKPRILWQQLQQTALETTDPDAFKTAQLTTQVHGNGEQLSFSDLKIQLDNSHLNGQLSFNRFNPPVIRFQCRLDTLDLDRYLPPKKTEAESSGFPALKPIQKLDINGQLNISQLKVAQLTMTDVALLISTDEGQLQISPSAQLYQGRYQGQLQLTPKQLNMTGHFIKHSPY